MFQLLTENNTYGLFFFFNWEEWTYVYDIQKI